MLACQRTTNLSPINSLPLAALVNMRPWLLRVQLLLGRDWPLQRGGAPCWPVKAHWVWQPVVLRKHLPDVLVTGTKVAGGAAERAVLTGAAENAAVVKGAEGVLAANPALREQTIAEKVSEKTFHFGIDTAKKVLRLMGRAEEAEAGVVVSDDVRRSGF